MNKKEREMIKDAKIDKILEILDNIETFIEELVWDKNEKDRQTTKKNSKTK